MSPLEGGGPPGLAGEGLEGTTDPGEQASNASILGLNPVGFMMGKGNPLGTIVGMAGRGLNSALGNPLGQFGGWLGDQIGNISPSLANALGVGHSMSSGMEGGVPAAQGFIGGDTHGGWGKGQSSESIAPPPSDLADIGIGGGVSGGGLFGGPGPSGDSGDAGVAAGIAVGFGGGDW